MLLAGIIILIIVGPTYSANLLSNKTEKLKWNWTKPRKTPTPIVLWHGLQDWCCGGSFLHLMGILKQKIPGVYIRSIKIGKTEADDRRNSLFLNMNTQVEIVCKRLREDPHLRNGYHAVGFSQGSQLLRGIAQRCPHPPMLNYVSLGGQHQGVFGFPVCPVMEWKCDAFRRFLDIGAYWDFIQHLLVPAQYWHDPFQEEAYREKSIYLADINNEKTFNASYKENLLKLKKMYLVVFLKDSIVIPRESSLFGYYAPGTVKKMLRMEQTDLYKSDRIGLKTLYESGRLKLGSIDADHVQVDDKSWSRIIEQYLMD